MPIKSYREFTNRQKTGWSRMEPYLGETAKTHYVAGQPHSINGQPSRIFFHGKQEWHKEGKLHNENGPAVTYPPSNIHPNGHREYYLEGKKLDKPEFNRQTTGMKEEPKIE